LLGITGVSNFEYSSLSNYLYQNSGLGARQLDRDCEENYQFEETLEEIMRNFAETSGVIREENEEKEIFAGSENEEEGSLFKGTTFYEKEGYLDEEADRKRGSFKERELNLCKKGLNTWNKNKREKSFQRGIQESNNEQADKFKSTGSNNLREKFFASEEREEKKGWNGGIGEGVGNEIDLNFLRKEFAVFYRNRLSSQSQQTFKSKIPVLNHKPKILEKSKELGERYREKFGNGDFLGFVKGFSKKKEVNKSKSIKMKTEEDMKECSFKPNILKTENNERDRSRIENLARPKRRGNDRGTAEIEFERERSECTFMPNIYSKERKKGCFFI
jgi:hypothetical protein